MMYKRARTSRKVRGRGTLAKYARRTRSNSRVVRKGKNKTHRRVKVSPLLASAINQVVSKSRELKRFGTLTTSAPDVSTTLNAVSTVVDITQGVGDSQRIGDQVNLTRIYLTYTLLNTSAFTTYGRLMVLKSKNLAASATPGNTGLIFQDPLSKDAKSFNDYATTTPYELIMAPMSSQQYTPIFSTVFKLGKTGAVEGADLINIRRTIVTRSKINFENAGAGINAQNVRYFILFVYWSPSGAATVTRNGLTMASFTDD